eukprot:GFKZ01011287.1.p1 GENE.GFKZ01011287.1~~GFKZ01011287.1.p1  ORF type:complete len:542 (-),score=46.82 GFKZ01011287.1:1508-3133(-)
MGIPKRPRVSRLMWQSTFVSPLTLGNYSQRVPVPCSRTRPPVRSLGIYCANRTISGGASQEAVLNKTERTSTLTDEYLASMTRTGQALQARNDHDTPRNAQAQTSNENTGPRKRGRRPNARTSEETRRKISSTMMGRPKSKEMRAKVSQALKGRVPWNKGKKMSPEVRARMSEAQRGRMPWNKGRSLSEAHRQAISESAKRLSSAVSASTKNKLRMARRRPGDGIVGGSSRAESEAGSFPLVGSERINFYITLRRELRVWSDSFVARNGRRPSLADVRRSASRNILDKFENYVKLRDQIRGLASDVYGSINPRDLPVVPPGKVSSSPQNNSQTVIRVTKHGNRRLVPQVEHGSNATSGYSEKDRRLEGSVEDMWDVYDRPVSPNLYSTDSGENHSSLIGIHELAARAKDKLSANDYRMIGRYRLMETIDINRYVSLRKELQRWSEAFRDTHGRTPTLSDAKSSGKSFLYDRFCEYLSVRDNISGLVREVCGTEIDDTESLRKFTHQGKEKLEVLRAGAKAQDEGEARRSSQMPPEHRETRA